MTAPGFGDDRAARGDGQSGKPRARDVLDRSRADRWQIEATVLAGLRRLHQNADAGRRHHAPLPPQVGDAGEQIVGAFRRFERKHVMVGDDRRLTDVERAKRGDQLQRHRRYRRGRAPMADSGQARPIAR